MSEECPQGRQAARGMTARLPGASLLGGVRPLERARCAAPAPGVTLGAGLCLVRAPARLWPKVLFELCS